MTTAIPTGNAYDKYASRNPVERRLMEGFFDALATCLPSSPPASVLEVGVGEGEVARRVARSVPRISVRRHRPVRRGAHRLLAPGGAARIGSRHLRAALRVAVG